jgi:hypothetical protein
LFTAHGVDLFKEHPNYEQWWREACTAAGKPNLLGVAPTTYKHK